MVTRKLNAQSHVARTGARHDRQAATRDVRQLKQQLDNLMLEMPAKILARGEIHQQTQHTTIQQRTFTIETLGRAELAQQLEAKAKDYGSYIKRANDWVKNNINKGLAGLVTVLNFWNVHTAMTDAGASGEWTTKDQLSVSTAAATMLSGLTALAIMPAWARMAGLTGEATVKGKAVQVRLVDSAAKYWHPDHGQHKALFKTFAKRAFAMSGLAVIASVAETFQIKEEIDNAHSEAEKLALQFKRVLTIGMGGVGTFQVFRSLGVFFGSRAAGLVFAPWIIVAFAIAGAAYLIISLVADSLKLEGLKLWLYRSSWSNSKADYWPDTEEGNKDELRALQEVLLRPTIVAQTLKGKMSDLNNPNRNGVWLKLVLPPDVAGQDIRIYPIMVAEGGWFSRDRQTGYRANLYADYFSEGNWIGLEQLGDWESLDVRKYRDQFPAQYAPEDWRVWLVHLPHRWGMDRLEVEIHYPPAMLDRPDTLGYRFNIDLDGMKAGSLHENPYVHGQVTEPDGGSRPLVIDSIPAGTRNILTLGVI